MAKVFVTRKIPGDHVKSLSDAGHEVIVSKFHRPLTAEELLEYGKGVDALLTLLTDKINGDVLDALGPQLKIVSNYAVGFDNINIQEASDRGVIVTNTPATEINESVAEFAWTLIFALAKRLVEADEATRKGAYKGWEPGIFLGVNLKGKTLGIIGLGRIGSMVARRAKGLEMSVVYNKRKPDKKTEDELGITFSELDELLAKSDFVTLHVPLTDETRHMMNKDTFAKMKKGAYLVNTSRGSVVDEHDLVDALRSGRLGGAGLDVFDNEPNINPELIAMENVILTPHIASATHEARKAYGEQATSSILAVLDGKQPTNMVDEKMWKNRRK